MTLKNLVIRISPNEEGHVFRGSGIATSKVVMYADRITAGNRI